MDQRPVGNQPTRQEANSTARAWLIAAAAIGVLNAAPSLYWGLGGDLLLASIGQWLISLREQAPLLIGAALIGLAAGKTAVALLPLLLLRTETADQGRPAPSASGYSPRSPGLALLGRRLAPPGRRIKALSNVAAALLFSYGSLGLLINAGTLMGFWGGTGDGGIWVAGIMGTDAPSAADSQAAPGAAAVADPTARWGQLLLWYPMLILWGAVLGRGLRRVTQPAPAS